MTAGYEWRHADVVARARELAAEIGATGGTGRKVVALECDRGLPSVIALLAVLEAGDIPLLGSAADPADRRARLREASGAAVVVTGSAAGAFTVAATGAGRPDPWPDAVYLAATSGTTGDPKIAPIDREVFEAYLHDIREVYGLADTDRVLQFAPAGFDVFVEEVVPTFRAGGTVVVPPWEHAPAAESFLDFLEAQAVTVVNLPSSYWMGVADFMRKARRGLPSSVRLVVIGSEPVTRPLIEWARESLPDVKLLNAYGTSELAPTCFVFDCDELPKATAHPDTVPIGGPLPFMRYELLPESEADGRGRLQLGVQPLAGGRPGPVYDTGDLASHESDGYVYLHGRADLTRLKRGGVTVNGESLAAVARECPGVLGAAARLDRHSGALLVIVQSAEAPEEVRERVAAHLKSVLPPAWQPDRIQVTSGLEHAQGAKLSTLTAQHAGTAAGAPAEATAEEAAEGPELASVVRDAWIRWTPAEEVDAGTDFFDAGGDSIGAVRMCSQLSDALLRKVPVQLIFANPRFGEFVQAVDTLRKSA
ncbi:non-ribosomal peptide synthetase [Streptomyces sp. XD-27]|uniref:non-ribosomal peptide synthetase n=1 Tax=Streptomyces sp. XD-27 TaxID=3062779 RepID=UPI0026F46766|nr:non-ribosomal peptide synthetase [Streptomyces sp. XD-27]WKX73984.1 non-ribosomal peptide synthetase [Streptomyces sp. XD-27]